MIQKLVAMVLSGVIFLGMAVSSLAMEFNEAPALRARVAAGELPPVEERLPEEPLIVVPTEEIGRFGGVWRTAHMGTGDLPGAAHMVREFLVRYSPCFTKIVPNVARDFSWCEDYKSVTFYLRRGMRWSDGAPFTAADFLFLFEDITLNEELTPVPPAILKAGGEIGTFEKIDDYTFKISFAVPYGMFTERLAGFFPPLMFAPKHYLKQFHPAHTPMEEIEKIMREEDFDLWIDLFGAKNRPLQCPDIPTINAWRPLAGLDAPLQIWARNPFYWKVDPEGNQLPYIDYIHQTLVADRETKVLKAIAGDLDFQARGIKDIANFPLIMEHRERGDFRVFPIIPTDTNLYTIFLNFHHQDPILRQLFRNKQFRVALSVAIDRNMINELLKKGLGTPSQGVPGPGPWYDPRLVKLYTEHDPKKANELLDEIGLRWDRNREFRLRPDGERLRIVISVFAGWPPRSVEAMELVRGNWKEIGLDAVVSPAARELWFTRATAAHHDVAAHSLATAWPGNPPLHLSLFPLGTWYFTAPMWGHWFATDGEAGEEPPEELKRLMEIYHEALRIVCSEKRNKLIREAYTITVENLLNIGILREPALARFGVATNRFRNIPKPPMSSSFVQYHPASFFIREE